MIRYIALVTLALLWLLSPSLVAAAAGIKVVDSRVDVSFPNQAVFTLEAESDVDIVDVRLCYQVDRMNYAEVVSEGWADFTPANNIEVNWVWDMSNGSLPPGAEVSYWWMIEDDDGDRVESSPKMMHFDDNRFAWQSLASGVPEGEGMTLFWYTGGDSFAQELMDVCEEGLAKLTEDIGAYPGGPIKIYIYASTSDLNGAMVYSEEWTGGVAFTDFGIIAISIPPSKLDWGKGALVHELTHLVVHQATFSPYGQLPLWLDEGLAMYNECGLDPSLCSDLEETILEHELISVRSLCSPFSAYTEKAYLSYAESYSLVEYLLSNYGYDKMLELLSVLKQGKTYDDALTEVYGFDINGLDTHWRATLTSHTVIAGEAKQSHSALMAALAALATGLALWGALASEKQTWRKSPGKSSMQDKL
jgi:hypothetical protein